MSLFYRRLTYIIFIIIFLVITPLIILYTAGYRYNFSKGRVQKTGMLIISSIPRNASVILNDQDTKKKTPAKIEKILPGDYEIKLTLDGYHNWQKKLPIYENTTAFAEKIILWKTATSSELLNLKFKSGINAPDAKKIALLSEKNELWVFDTNNDKGIFLNGWPANYSLKIIGWSSDSNQILLSVQTDDRQDLFVFNYQNNAKQKIANDNYQAIKWDRTKPTTLYGANQTGLWELDLTTGKRKLASQIITNDFYWDNNQLYFIKGNKLYVKNVDESGSGKLIEELSLSQGKIIAKSDNRLLIQSEAESKLSFIDLEKVNKTVTVNAKKVDWLNKQVLLFYNDWEIFIYDLNKKDPELMTRWGDKIEAATWHNQGRHIIFSSTNKIQVIELDNRELRNVIELADQTSSWDLLLNGGKDLYYVGSSGEHNGVFKIRIQ